MLAKTKMPSGSLSADGGDNGGETNPGVLPGRVARGAGWLLTKDEVHPSVAEVADAVKEDDVLAPGKGEGRRQLAAQRSCGRRRELERQRAADAEQNSSSHRHSGANKNLPRTL